MQTHPRAPLPEHRFRRPYRLREVVREIWGALPLVRALAERRIRALYKQAFLGMGWALVTPVTLMLVFTLVFTRVANVDTHGAPYPLFSYIALVPWQFFSSSVSSGGLAIISQMSLVNKIRCPREVFPLSEIVTSAVSAIIASGVVIVLFVIYRYPPKLTSFWVPVILVVQITATVAVVLAVSGITVYLRDLRHALPILMQIALFATPIAYSIDFVPSQLQVPYVIVNPMAAVIESYRATVLYGTHPRLDLLLPAFLSSVVALYAASRLFRRLELRFADVA
jgi:ABC-type polysaccharide/polyol phosphate export permease